MKKNYNLNHRLIAFALLVGLFLQGCGNSFNQPTPQDKEQADDATGIHKHVDTKLLVNKELKAEKGYLISFHEGDNGMLQADVRVDETQREPNYRNLPVIIEEATDLASFIKLPPIIQRRRINLNCSQSEEARYVTICTGTLLAGMWEGEDETEPEQVDELDNASIPNECFCPITHEIMEDPVISQDGHTYERSAIQQWFNMGKRISPKTGARLLSTELMPNHTMRSLIQDLKSQMPVLARHKLDMQNIEAAIKLREEEMEEQWAQKENALEKETRLRISLEKELEEKTTLLSIMEQQIQAFKLREKEMEEHLEALIKIFKLSKNHHPQVQFNLEEAYNISQGLAKDEVKTVDKQQYSCENRKNVEKEKEKEKVERREAMEEYIIEQDVLAEGPSIIEKYQKLAEAGDAEFQFKLGYLYYGGFGWEKDHKKAFKWFEKAAGQRYANAQGMLGRMYYLGLSASEDKLQAIQLFLQAAGNVKKSAEQGNEYAQNILGFMYEHGLVLNKNIQHALQWYRKSAEQGNALAQFNLGAMYKNGQGVEKDYSKAIEWYTKAANQSHAYAQYNLAGIYKNGQGIEKNYIKALEWFIQAANQGLARAQKALGDMYFCGQGVSQNKQKAVEWYQKAAEQGDAEVQYNLGSIYKTGNGVIQNFQEAVKWYQKAAEQGLSLAQFAIGNMYICDGGIVKNYDKALKWSQKAADQGDVHAQEAIIAMYNWKETGSIRAGRRKRLMILEFTEQFAI